MKSLNIGAGFDEEGDIKIDIVGAGRPHVLSTASPLPFVDESFDLEIIDQVLEYILSNEFTEVPATSVAVVDGADMHFCGEKWKSDHKEAILCD